MTKAEAIDVIRKLKVMAAHESTTGHEAATAGERADQLMEKYKVTEEDLKAPAQEELPWDQIFKGTPKAEGDPQAIQGFSEEYLKELMWHGLKQFFSWMSRR